MYSESKIWKKCFERKGDSYDKGRDIFCSEYESFRKRIESIIQSIGSEIPGLTVHDITHLDDLWIMADFLLGEDYEINPAEGFLLGGAILLHDSAMTVHAYPGKEKEVKESTEYADALAQIGYQLKAKSGGEIDAEKIALQEALRIKHANQAEKLASMKWTMPGNGDDVYLIDNSDIRDHFASSIGLVARSHHWDVSDISMKLASKIGAYTGDGFSPDWSVDLVKISAILRCIDAMHIDDRRAPRHLFSVRQIYGVSQEHWKFQNRLARPYVDKQLLVYSSKSPFLLEDSAAWNLCFDTIKVIDEEIRKSGDLLEQKGIQGFSVRGVAGAGSAEALAEFIRVEGWRPLPLNLKVSNVSHLAKTLGGSDLYSFPLAPLRELIQNAADAVQARVAVDDEFGIEDGEIVVNIREASDSTILEVKDNGVGMPERVMMNAILDFGFSFWRSESARKEYPGLQAHADGLRGRYGIGFFSVFMWSDDVCVTSRSFRGGVEETRSLAFTNGVESRPILRPSSKSESSTKWSTTVRLNLPARFFSRLIPKPDDDRGFYSRRAFRYGGLYDSTWVQRLRLLCGPLPVKALLDLDGVLSEVSLPAWRDCEPKKFFDFFDGVFFEKSEFIERFVKSLTCLSDPAPEGGRCFAMPRRGRGGILALYEKGIFVSEAHAAGVCGIVESRAINAARDRASALSVATDEKWLDEARSKAFLQCRNIAEKVSLQDVFGKLGSIDPNHPYFLMNREFLSLVAIKDKVVEQGGFSIRVHDGRHASGFSWKAPGKLAVILDLDIDETRIYPLSDIEINGFRAEDFKSVLGASEGLFYELIRAICSVMDSSFSVKVDYVEAEGYANESFYSLSFS